MANMKSSLALAIFLIYFLGGLAVLFLTSLIMVTQSTIRRLSHIEKIPNLGGSKFILNEMNSENKSQENKKEMELSNLDQDEFVLSLKQISSKSSPKKKLENSSDNIDGRMMVVLLLNLLSLHFTFAIVFSFLVDQNECCNNFDGDYFCPLALFTPNISITYFSTKACGKHTSRYVGITFVMLISIINCILTGIFLSGNTYIYLLICIIYLLNVLNINYFMEKGKERRREKVKENELKSKEEENAKG